MVGDMKKQQNFCRRPYCSLPDKDGYYDKPKGVSLRSWIRGLKETWGSDISFIDTSELDGKWVSKYIKEHDIPYGRVRIVTTYKFGKSIRTKFMKTEDAVMLRMSHPDPD